MGTKLNNETNSEGNNKLVLISIFFLFLCLTSCIAEQPANVTTYINLLDKIKDFLAFSCFILDNSSNYYGQVISRIYYAYYTLARIININKTEYDNSYGGSHEHIWNNIKNKTISTKYGNELKWKRCKYDYDDIRINNNTDIIKDFEFIKQNESLFNEEINMIQKTLEDNPNLTNDDDNIIKNKLQEIQDTHIQMIEKINNKMTESKLKKRETKGA